MDEKIANLRQAVESWNDENARRYIALLSEIDRLFPPEETKPNLTLKSDPIKFLRSLRGGKGNQ